MYLETTKEKRSRVKGLVKQVHDESWIKFIGSIKDDIYGRQRLAYKILKGMNKNKNYTSNSYNS